MKTKSPEFCDRLRQLGLAALAATINLTLSGLGLVGAPMAVAQTPLFEGHADVGIDYDAESNHWNLHVHDEANDQEYSPPTETLLFVRSNAHGTVPAGAEWSFLGSPGGEVWTLPSVQNPNLLFLGIGSEEIADGTFAGDQFTLALKNVIGPGHFALFDYDSFGDPVVWMNTRDGIDGADAVTMSSGRHSHANWSFSAPGDYTLWFEASALSVDHGFTSSGDVPYTFHVQAVPEPGAFVLLGMAMVTLVLRRRR